MAGTVERPTIGTTELNAAWSGRPDSGMVGRSPDSGMVGRSPDSGMVGRSPDSGMIVRFRSAVRRGVRVARQ